MAKYYCLRKKNVAKNHKKLPAFDGITFIYVGTPVLKDNLSAVINVVTRLIMESHKIRFCIFGVTKEQYLSLHTQNLSPLIIFMGTIPQDDIIGYYGQSDFMTLIRDKSRKNMMGFPTKFSEAITSGIPIITNETSDIPAYLKDGYNGFLLKEPTEEYLYSTLRNRILKLSKDDVKNEG